MILREGEVIKLSVDPACSGSQETILRLELWEHELLHHILCIALIISTMLHVVSQETECVHKSFFFAQITVGLLHALEDEVEKVSQVFANFLVASLPDFAHISN